MRVKYESGKYSNCFRNYCIELKTSKESTIEEFERINTIHILEEDINKFKSIKSINIEVLNTKPTFLGDYDYTTCLYNDADIITMEYIKDKYDLELISDTDSFDFRHSKEYDDYFNNVVESLNEKYTKDYTRNIIKLKVTIPKKVSALEYWLLVQKLTQKYNKANFNISIF